ncbi:MAG: DUF2975 domain-containing protein [Flavobacteriaceae bacterium]|nr:DUF2975 domain-containing protein [Flavobacteriaceae bacterium]
MRKLLLLKTIIDILWIISMPILLIILFIIPYIFLSDDYSSIPIKINENTISHIDFISKGVLSIMASSTLLVLYCIYLFKKVLLLFSQRRMFDDSVLINLNKIGEILIWFSIINIIGSFIYNLNLNKVSFEISISPLILTLSLGLFFMVLSEIFKIAKDTKEENDLTV